MRYKCIVAYDGTNFHGFQVQNDLRCVQSEIEAALLVITKKKTKIYGAGRTDAGVHAYGQVFHFDFDVVMKPEFMKNAINCRLPNDIHILKVEHVSDNFHARFNALAKTYEYLMDFGEVDPLKVNYRWYYKYKLNIDLLKESAKVFIGTHDFKAITKNHKLENTVRTIYSIDFEEEGTLLKIKFRGNGFLHNQVRIMVAMMVEVARGKITISDLENVLKSLDRKKAPKTAPANGLYLMDIEY